MRKLASIQRIKDIQPIEGADRIELAHVLGWQCVVPKGQFKPGDLCVYFEIDSFLPVRPEFEFLRKSSFKNSELLGEGFLLRTQKFRGQISQGLVMPIKDLQEPLGIEEIIFGDPEEIYESEFTEGEDVTDCLGVCEYKIPEKATGSGTIVGEASKYIHVTDETRIQSAPELLKEFEGVPYYITTKMDGSSHSICIDDSGKFHVFGHNYEYKDDGKSSFYEFVKKHDFEKKLREFVWQNNLDPEKAQIKSITVQGEWCGNGIQKNRMQLKKPNWFVFTVDFNGERQPWKIIKETADYIEADTVPFEEEGSDLLKKYPDEDALLKRAGENKCHAYPGQCEGIVIRPLKLMYSKVLQGPLSMKVINNKYLLKKK